MEKHTVLAEQRYIDIVISQKLRAKVCVRQIQCVKVFYTIPTLVTIGTIVGYRASNLHLKLRLLILGAVPTLLIGVNLVPTLQIVLHRQVTSSIIPFFLKFNWIIVSLTPRFYLSIESCSNSSTL